MKYKVDCPGKPYIFLRDKNGQKIIFHHNDEINSSDFDFDFENLTSFFKPIPSSDVIENYEIRHCGAGWYEVYLNGEKVYPESEKKCRKNEAEKFVKEIKEK